MLDNTYWQQKQRFLSRLPKNDFIKDDPVSESDLNDISNSVIGMYSIIDKLFNNENTLEKTTDINSNLTLHKGLNVNDEIRLNGNISIGLGQGISIPSLLSIFLNPANNSAVSINSTDGNKMELKDTNEYFGLFLNDKPFFVFDKAQNCIYSEFDIKTNGKVKSSSLETDSIKTNDAEINRSLSIQNPQLDSSGKNIPVNVRLDGNISLNSLSCNDIMSNRINASDSATLNSANIQNLSSTSLQIPGVLDKNGNSISMYLNNLTVFDRCDLNTTNVSGKLTSRNYDFGGHSNFTETDLDVAWSSKMVGIEVKSGIITRMWRH